MKRLQDNGWDIEQKGEIYIPKGLEIWLLDETKLKQQTSIKVKINRTKSDAFRQVLIVTPKENSYFSEAQNFSTFYESFLSNSCPVGSILPFGGAVDKIPAGWQLCDGGALDPINFPELFSVLKFGWGQGMKGQFHKPDLRGAFLRGSDPEGKLDPDKNRAVGSLQGHALQDHWHRFIKPRGNGGGNRPYGEAGGSHNVHESDFPNLVQGVLPNVLNAKVSSETRPVNFAVNYIIRCL